jgi:hypothetical protein
MDGFIGGSRTSSKATWREDVVQRHKPAASTFGPVDDESFVVLRGVVHRDIVEL